MDPDSRKIIHLGAHWVLTPMPVLDIQFYLSIQRFLAESGIVISRTQFNQEKNEIDFFRETGFDLKIKILAEGPVGHILVLSQGSDRGVAEFSEEVNKAVKAFELSACTPPRQIITKDSTIRCLYLADRSHSFQEIWEGFLGQDKEKLKFLGRPVLGGGLRFIMPPISTENDPVQIELKIESFLQDSSRIFLDVEHVWPKHSEPGAKLEPNEMLGAIEEFITRFVGDFGRDDDV